MRRAWPLRVQLRVQLRREGETPVRFDVADTVLTIPLDSAELVRGATYRWTAAPFHEWPVGEQSFTVLNECGLEMLR